MKLKATITAEWEVKELSHYDALTIEEAAMNQQKWLDEGIVEIFDLFDTANSVVITAVPEGDSND